MADTKQVKSTPRKQALERTAEVRAKIIAYLSGIESPYATMKDLRDAVPELAEVGNPSSLLVTMTNNGLVKTKELDDSSPYKTGYYIKEYTGEIPADASAAVTDTSEVPQKRGYTKKLDRPEVGVEADRIVIDHPRCRIIVELK